MDASDIGPRLRDLLEAHEVEASVLRSLRTAAASLGDLVDQLDWPMLVSVGPVADRVLGAAAVLRARPLECWDRRRRLDGHHALLVVIADPTGLMTADAARLVKGLGATVVSSCGVLASERVASSTDRHYTLSVECGGRPARRGHLIGA